MTKVTIDQQIAEIEDEIKRRERSYPVQVKEGRMRHEEADIRLKRMIAIRYTLKWLKIIEPRLKNGYIEKAATVARGPINCSTWLRFQGKAYPRTCERCRLGPCPFFHDDGRNKYE